MMAIILFFISMAAFGQLGIYYWRASIAEVSRTPVSDRANSEEAVEIPAAIRTRSETGALEVASTLARQ